MAYYYIETDGHVFLAERGGRLCFPDSKKHLDFKIKIIRKLAFSDMDVFFCEPLLSYHPEKWLLKDDILLMDNVDKIVKRSIVHSYVRHVAHAVILIDGRVLMVKASRGLTKGIWNLPGGFIRYGETPEESLLREIREETGLDAKVKKLLGVHTKTFMDGFYVMSLLYLCSARGKLKVSRKEIEEIRFFDIEEAVKKTGSPFSKAALRKLLKSYSKI